MKTKEIVAIAKIENLIYIVRGQRVMLDFHLAEMYGVPTRTLNQAVRRNLERFPADFMFQLTKQEVTNLKSQFVISSFSYGGRRSLPLVFTEHGAIMAANVLNSDRAVSASVYVVRAFVKLREVLASHKELARKLKQLERRLDGHDDDLHALVSAIRQLMSPPATAKKRIGFRLK